jgi:hypothetical protein
MTRTRRGRRLHYIRTRNAERWLARRRAELPPRVPWSQISADIEREVRRVVLAVACAYAIPPWYLDPSHPWNTIEQHLHVGRRLLSA